MITRPHALVAGLCGLLLAGVCVRAEVGRTSRLMYGEVIAAERTMVETGRSKSGAATGATIGAIAGYILSDGQWLGTAIGGVAGGAIGSGPKNKRGWNLVVRLKEGDEVAVQVLGKGEAYVPGDKVRLFVKEDGQIDAMKLQR